MHAQLFVRFFFVAVGFFLWLRYSHFAKAAFFFLQPYAFDFFLLFYDGGFLFFFFFFFRAVPRDWNTGDHPLTEPPLFASLAGYV